MSNAYGLLADMAHSSAKRIADRYLNSGNDVYVVKADYGYAWYF